MCNLNILIKHNNIDNINIVGFMQSVTSNSYASNSHSEGVYCDFGNKLIKSLNKIDYEKLRTELNKSKIIITHQRYATSGEGVKYAHPFMNNDFVVVHNGIINHFKDNQDTANNHSDTFAFFNVFNKMFNKRIKDNNNRNVVITEIIKELFEADKGSYSIFIYDRINNKGYYFKDSVTNIHIYKSKDYLYITTNDKNNLFLTMLNQKFIEYDIKKRIIYDINIEKLGVYNLFEWKNTTTQHNYSTSNKKNKKKKQQQSNKDNFSLNNYSYDNSGFMDYIKCSSCNQVIIGVVNVKNNNYYCEECIKDNQKINAFIDDGY
jgi:glucosamine 6-phosphate synthetase-like amidotransferase/phosphosugar isomerase protein